MAKDPNLDDTGEWFPIRPGMTPEVARQLLERGIKMTSSVYAPIDGKFGTVLLVNTDVVQQLGLPVEYANGTRPDGSRAQVTAAGGIAHAESNMAFMLEAIEFYAGMSYEIAQRRKSRGDIELS